MEETLAQAPAFAASGARLAVRVLSGADAGARLVLRGPITIGTSEVCDLRLTDRTVSRRHLAVEPSALGVRARDLASRNGVWAGTVRVVEAELAPGTTIRIGDTELTIEPDDAAAGEVAEPAPPPPRDRFGRFLGAAPALQLLYAQLARVAATQATVLIEGESGTGKELLAEALHEQGVRPEGPLVVVDCGSIPETLIESELFGHERGAFTGADRRRAGAFEQAHGGTIFLDEIGELPLAMQTRLLRALDQRQIRRVGASEPLAIDVRVVAATHRNLDREVEQGRFRLDLFHRLAVVLVRVPPLRERRSDIPFLARELAIQLGAPEAITPSIAARLESQDWPGNVRELRNHVERIVLLGEGAFAPVLGAAAEERLRNAARSGLPYRQARVAALDVFTDAYIEDMLERHGGNVSAAARAAGVARRYFQRMKRR